MQNLVSRVAGVNNEELANRGIGMGAAMSNTVKSIVYQFKGNSEDGKAQGQDIISRVINKANHTESEPASGVSYENYSKNIMEEQKNNSITKTTNPTENITNNTNTVNNTVQNEIKEQGKASGIKKAYNVGKEFMNFGMYMAERKKFQE